MIASGCEDGSDDGAFARLMDRVRAGDHDAAREVHLRWTRRLVKLARSRLGRVIAGKEDPEDVVQSVYRSFFRRVQGGTYRVEAWEDVWSLLATIARRKCSSRRDHYQAIKRDARRELPLIDDSTPVHEPTPEEATMLAETVERLLRRLGKTAQERLIVEMSLQGESAAEIYSKVGCSERTIYRVRSRARDVLEAWNRDEVRMAVDG